MTFAEIQVLSDDMFLPEIEDDEEMQETSICL